MAFELPEKPKPEPSPAKKWQSAFKIVTAATRFKVPDKVDEVPYTSRSAARRSTAQRSAAAKSTLTDESFNTLIWLRLSTLIRLWLSTLIRLWLSTLIRLRPSTLIRLWLSTLSGEPATSVVQEPLLTPAYVRDVAGFAPVLPWVPATPRIVRDKEAFAPYAH